MKSINENAEAFMKGLSLIKETGVSPWAVYTQACHETGWFKHVIGLHNYWGIKKPSRWSGRTHRVRTHEYKDGQKIEIYAEFADWDTADEALAWYLGLIERLYPNAWRCRHCEKCFFEGLVNGRFKWATDPIYSRKLQELLAYLKKEDEVTRAFDKIVYGEMV